MLSPGWWVALEGERSSLHELAMHFSAPELNIVQEADGFFLGSNDLNDLASTDDVRSRGAELLAIACGAAQIELGGLTTPRVVAAVQVDEAGDKQRLTPVGASVRLVYDINQLAERPRPDGSVEVVELGPPPPRAPEWPALARHDEDVADALAILGRAGVRWHDLYYVFEIVQADVGGRIYSDGWVTKAAVRRFAHTANSRGAIGHEARHGREMNAPPAKPMELAEARRLVVSLVRHWLAGKVPPPEPRVIRVVEVRPAPPPTSDVGG